MDGKRYRFDIDRKPIGYEAQAVPERAYTTGRGWWYHLQETVDGPVLSVSESDYVNVYLPRNLSRGFYSVARVWNDGYESWSADHWGVRVITWRPTRVWAFAAVRAKLCRRIRRMERKGARAARRRERSVTIHQERPCG